MFVEVKLIDLDTTVLSRNVGIDRRFYGVSDGHFQSQNEECFIYNFACLSPWFFRRVCVVYFFQCAVNL